MLTELLPTLPGLVTVDMGLAAVPVTLVTVVKVDLDGVDMADSDPVRVTVATVAVLTADTVATVPVFTADQLTATVRVIQDMVMVPFTGPNWVVLAKFQLLQGASLRLGNVFDYCRN